MLLVVVFLPFPTSLLGDFLGRETAAPAVVLYVSVMVCQSIAWILMGEAALKSDIPKSESARATVRANTNKGYYGLAVYSLCAVLAFWYPWAVLTSPACSGCSGWSSGFELRRTRATKSASARLRNASHHHRFCGANSDNASSAALGSAGLRVSDTTGPRSSRAKPSSSSSARSSKREHSHARHDVVTGRSVVRLRTLPGSAEFPDRGQDGHSSTVARSRRSRSNREGQIGLLWPEKSRGAQKANGLAGGQAVHIDKHLVGMAGFEPTTP